MTAWEQIRERGRAAATERMLRGAEALAQLADGMSERETRTPAEATIVAMKAVTVVTLDDLDAAIDAACEAMAAVHSERPRYARAIKTAFIASGFEVLA